MTPVPATATPVPANLLQGVVAPGSTTVTDDTGRLSISVAPGWTDVNPSSWTNDDFSERPHLVVAPVIGPTLGGWISDNYSWHWVFLINVPMGLLSLFLVGTLVSEPSGAEQERRQLLSNGLRVDYVGFALVAVRRDPNLDPTARFPALRTLSWLTLPNGELNIETARRLLLSL